MSERRADGETARRGEQESKLEKETIHKADILVPRGARPCSPPLAARRSPLARSLTALFSKALLSIRKCH